MVERKRVCRGIRPRGEGEREGRVVVEGGFRVPFALVGVFLLLL